jgi:hypothetical protein
MTTISQSVGVQRWGGGTTDPGGPAVDSLEDDAPWFDSDTAFLHWQAEKA